MVRRGFTLVELLVATGAVGVLVGLLLPAVQAARARAAVAGCCNNLRQVGLAAHGFEAAAGRLPRSPGPDQYPPGWLWEQRAFMGADRAGRGDVVPVLRCPSRSSPAAEFQGLNGQTDYAGAGGPAPWADGGAIGQRGVRFCDLRNGASGTLLAAHTRFNAARPGVAQHARDWGWVSGWDWDTVRWTALPPAGDWLDAAPGWYSRDSGSDGERFGGPHAGCPSALADGSVRVVSLSVAPATWRAAGDRNAAAPVALE